MAANTLESPYPSGPGLRWLKGNLHAHTTRSDGQAEIQHVIRGYAELGHDFLQISDHDLLADYAGLDSCGLTLIPGVEISAGGPHVLNVGGTCRVEPGERQRVIDEVNASGGLSVLCHPDWERAFDHIPIRQLRTLRDYCGIEIFNGGVHWGKGGGLAVNKWDMLLSAGRTQPIWGFANDDSHSMGQIGRAWNVVRTSDQSVGGIVAALRRGAFYCSTGVAIEAIECDGTTIQVVAPDAEALAVQGEHGQRLAFVEGPRLTFDAAEIASPFIRVDCFGRGERRAWSQPITVAGPDMTRLRGLLSARPVFKAFRSDRAPRLTGRIDDPLWPRAEPISDFHLHPRATAPVVRTEVRAILAGDVLFVAVRCEEPNLTGLRTLATADRGNIWADDCIEIFFDPEGRAESYSHIQSNAAGQAVAQHSSGRRGLAGLEVVAGRFAGGWSLELAIPLTALGESPRPGQVWGFNIHRNRPQDRGNMSWSWGGSSYHAPEYFGRIEF